MNVQIRHNNVSITSRVIAYTREHQICTSIGRLQLTLEGTYSTAIEPHDTIDIYEEGDFKVKYYVSQVSENQPEGTIVLECQDRSKYIVDYFIPDTYTIDYPSYTRYWIEKFLTEAGISYSFTTSSQGNLISNNTALGLQPAYDQIMMLLQLSGWYMYFDGDGVATIGTLNTDLANTAGSINNTDILNISRVSDDKMLRNRAVVWGEFDPLNREYAYADITKHTPWNYDHNDLRTMVISNQNIPNKSSANNIANILLKEFAKITVEKHITVHGARDWNLGESLRVNSRVWRGKGLITTFGVSMDRSGGLVTNVILDERCPRLFGFFNFGDYVYVSTFGDGVWRKHIKFDPTWYNFSTGLTDLNITDLHINNGIFGAVGHSGVAYYANNEEGPWYVATITGLESSVEDNVPSGQAVAYQVFSGLMTRATIVDKELNTVKYGIDTWSGLNTGDYFLSYSGYTSISGAVSSGVSSSGGNRAWIVEVDPYTGLPLGGIGSGIYPISYSGNYDFLVVDLENDGINDYVSVAGIGSGVTYDDGYDFGKQNTADPYSTHDFATRVGFSALDYSLEGQSLTSLLTSNANPRWAAFHNELNDERDIVWYQSVSGTSTFKRYRVSKAFNPTFGYNTVSGATTTSASQSGTGFGTLLGIYRESIGIFRFFHEVRSSVGTVTTYTVKYRRWDSNTNTVDSDVDVGSISFDYTDSETPQNQIEESYITLDDTIYMTAIHMHGATNGTNNLNYVNIYIYKVTMGGLSFQGGNVATFNFESFNDAGAAAVPGWNIRAINGSNLTDSLFQKGETPNYACWLAKWNSLIAGSATSLTNYLIYSLDGLSYSIAEIQTATSSSDADFLLSSTTSETVGTQLHENHYIYYARKATGATRPTYVFNGTTVSIIDETAGVPYYWVEENVHPVFGNARREYLAKTGSDYYWIDIDTLQPAIQMPIPDGYTLTKPFSTTSTASSDRYFWFGTDIDLSENVILELSRAGAVQRVINPYVNPSFSQTRGKIVGNFFIDINKGVGFTQVIRVLYVDNIYPALNTSTYLVLQRENSDFNLIQQASKPIRVDISNTSPVLTVQDYENTFQSNFVYGDSLTQVIPVSGLQSTEVRDYRYTLLETLSGVVVASGSPVGNQIVYVTGSGIYTSDTDTYSGGFVLFNSSPSGLLERIETSNFTYPGQFLFVTTSGDTPTFFQKDNDGLIFVEYSGLPSSRATMIRVDDRF